MPTHSKICVIGGGWYGCHIAKVLAEANYEVTLYEKEDRLMQGASGYNSFRLHRGPHYPRDRETRMQVNESFRRFKTTYPEFCIDQYKAWYAIGDLDSEGEKSLTNADDFGRICRECDPKCFIEDPSVYDIANVETLINVNEMTISVDQPERLFQRLFLKLGVTVDMGCVVAAVTKPDDGDGVVVKVKRHVLKPRVGVVTTCELFDFVVNCTYYTAFTDGTRDEQIFYEPCVTYFYSPKEEALTRALVSLSIFDGMFPSIDPYITNRHDLEGKPEQRRPSVTNQPGEVLYILTHAKYTPLGEFKSYGEAKLFMESVERITIEERREKMEETFKHYYMNFDKNFEYVGEFLSIKTKLRSDTAFRGVLVWKDSSMQMMHVFSGKVSTIFQAGDAVLQYLSQSSEI